MDLQMTTVFTYAYIGTISTSFAVNDAVGNFGLLGRRCIFIQLFRKKKKKNILYSRMLHYESSCTSKGLLMPSRVLLLT